MRFATITAFMLVITVAVIPACKKKNSSSSTENQNTPAPGPTPPAPGPSGANTDTGVPQVPVYSPNSVNVAAARTFNKNNLRQIGLAMLNFQGAYGYFPGGIYDSTGKVGLSWRVAILPFIEQQALYQQFHLDEPWDSAHNKTLITKMPKTFDAGAGSAGGYTFYRSFSGANAFIPPAKAGQAKQPVRAVQLQNIQDGTANTFMVAEAYEPVIWTKPDELAYAPDGPAPKLGGVFSDGFHVVFCHGGVNFFKTGSMPDKEIKAAITTGGGEIVNFP